MRVLGLAIKLRDILQESLQVNSWLDTVGILLTGYQQGSRVIATKAVQQSIPTGVQTTLVYESSIAADTMPYEGSYNRATGRFIPGREGYYQVNASLEWAAGITGGAFISIWKNGSELFRGTYTDAVSKINAISVLIPLIETDYLDIKCYQSSGASQLTANSTGTYLQIYLARPA